ncbi:hypothetical protein MKW98_007830 [Papaver atlanticum]|uniref:SCP domain-containing protein n=1 Tax=Papaver atlanticum TaxID=357466 RepID=A0AAD4RZ47_9MAGN|nr:hypothetical protein MKW98_007830 [Papaver atlanticum]
MASSCFQLIFSGFLVLFISCFINTTHAAQNSTDFINQMLVSHNAARAVVGVPPLVWEPLLARYARVYSNQRRGDCELIHSPGEGFGENLFWGQGHKYWNATIAVGEWVAEKQWYNYDKNTCLPDKVCTHYTQIVWRSTIRVGCAQIVCDSGDTFITCEYYPPGNYIGSWPY